MEPLLEPLTHRELEVLSLFAAGLSNQEVAERLTVAPSTAKWYARQIYAKLGVNSRAEAVERARKLALIDPGHRQSNLPAPTTPFVGRLDELRALKRLLRDPDCRLLSLVGMGGMGKTRLAIQVAQELLSEGIPALRDGAYFTSLTTVYTTENIPSAIAESLCFDFHTAEASPQDQLIDYLRRKHLLLILDNFEHLGSASSAALLSSILESASGVKLLITSRERLILPGEQAYLLGGLQTAKVSKGEVASSDPQELMSHSSILLFIQAARRSRPDFNPDDQDILAIANICQIVDGMPLAIELAAAWVAALPPTSILTEIENSLDFLGADMHTAPARQRSLRAVFDTSWKLLSAQERQTVGQLSVFRGGFTRQAAQDIADIPLNTILKLVNKSWLHYIPIGTSPRQPVKMERYQFHPLVQVYAAEAQSTKMETILQRHSEYYCAFIQEHRKDLRAHREKEALAEMEVEIGNLQAAWRWAVERGRLDLINLAMNGLCTYYDIRGRFDEGACACMEAADAIETYFRGDLLQGRACLLANLLAWQGHFTRDYQAQANLLERAQAVLDRDRLSSRKYLAAQAMLWHIQGQHLAWWDRQGAIEYFQRSLELSRELGDEQGQMHTMAVLGWAFWTTGDADQSRIYLEAALRMQRKIGDQRGISYSLNIMSFLSGDQGQMEQAEVMQRESLALLEQIGARFGIADRLFCLASTLSHRGNNAEALEMAQRSEQVYNQIGYRGPYLAKPFIVMAQILLDMGRYGETQTAANRGMEIASEYNNRQDIGGALDKLGGAALALGDLQAALGYCIESKTVMEAIHHRQAIMPLTKIVFVLRGLDQFDQSTKYLRSGISSLLDSSTFLYAGYALAPASLLFADLGQHERAIEIYTLAHTYPRIANSRWITDLCANEVDALRAALTSERILAAVERGKALDVRKTLQDILVELS